MPTYDYECQACSRRFERRQPITEAPLRECPECRGEVHRLVSGGTGFIVKGGGRGGPRGGGCSLEQGGRTCCGRDERCSAMPGCGGGR
ncbi:MAG: zinc ribbon domain-containing protein [Deltaproteobacteria bacterium]|nr:zinc ribbon domain-containing protein [Deltaproteobacteria bacterium]